MSSLSCSVSRWEGFRIDTTVSQQIVRNINYDLLVTRLTDWLYIRTYNNLVCSLKHVSSSWCIYTLQWTEYFYMWLIVSRINEGLPVVALNVSWEDKESTSQNESVDIFLYFLSAQKSSLCLWMLDFFFFLTPAFWEWNDCGHKLNTKLLFSLLHSKCSLEFIFCIPGRHVWSSFFWSVRWRTPRWSLHFVEFGWSTLLDDCRSQQLLCLNCVCVRIKVCLTLSGEAFHSLLSTRGRCVCSRVI